MQKDLYLTEDNHESKTAYWLEECKRMKKYVAYDFDISTVALLILDMQNFFLDETNHAFVPSALSIIDNISKLISLFNHKQRPIIFTKHIDTEQPDHMMTKWWRDSVRDGTTESEITSLLNTNLGELLIKNRYSAFEKTDLENKLKSSKVKQVIITGIMSHLCCETTTRDAFMRDFEVFFVVNANATYTEELHLGTLRAISHGFGRCVSTEEIVNE